MFYDNGHEAVLRNSQAGALVDTRPLLRLVYMWMSVGLLVTAAVAWFIASDVQRVLSIVSGGMFILVFIVQLGLVIGLNWGIRRLSPGAAAAMFMVYSASMGLTVGVAVFAAMYSGATPLDPLPDIMPVAKAFFTTAALFGAMTVIGFTTKVDLSKFSSFFMMALIGLFIAMLVNMFLQSSVFDLAISAFGVLLFTGLTAWDTQKIKEMAQMAEFQEYSDDMRKMSILGALTLYMDVINLFLFLLRLFSHRD